MHKRKMSYLVSYTTLVNLVWCLTSWCENNYKCKAIFVYLLKFLVILNMILGNLIAITQTSIKRMLAYTSLGLVLFSFHIEKPWKFSSFVTIVHPPFPLFGDALSSWKYAYYDLEGQDPSWKSTSFVAIVAQLYCVVWLLITNINFVLVNATHPADCILKQLYCTFWIS